MRSADVEMFAKSSSFTFSFFSMSLRLGHAPSTAVQYCQLTAQEVTPSE